MSNSAFRYKAKTKRSPKQQREYELRQSDIAKLCMLYEDTYAKWRGENRKLSVTYHNGYYIVGQRKVREATLVVWIQSMQQDIEMQEHLDSLTKGGEAGTGEEAWPGGSAPV